MMAANDKSFGDDWSPALQNGLRVFAAVVLGYLLTNSASVFLGQLLPFSDRVAVGTALMLSYFIYGLTVIWIYHTKNVVTVLAGMIAAIVATSIGSWLLMSVFPNTPASIVMALIALVVTPFVAFRVFKNTNETEIDAAAQAGLAAGTGGALTILFGSQTGNAESVAEDAAESARAHGLSPIVMDMDDVDVAQLPAMERLLVVASTTGEGELTDNAQYLWDALSGDDVPSLENTHFSVLSLGDSSYANFCEAGKLWDQRLEQLGAQRIADRVDCDVEFEELSQTWMADVLPVLATKGSAAVAPLAAAPATASKKAKSKYNRNNPFEMGLNVKKVLNKEGSSKEIVHYEFSLAGTGESYEAGDALNVIVENRPDLVAEFLQHFGATFDDYVEWKSETQKLGALLTEALEIRTPSRELVAELAKRNGDDELNRLLENNDPEALAAFLYGQDSLDLLKSYPCDLNAQEFCDLCKPMAARAYSISSSINTHPEEVHLTIASVRYNQKGRDHNGVASTFLADILQENSKVKGYFSPNKNFSVPEDDGLPMIMVGPGTGIAPFRAFLEERQVRGAKGDNWLFFGDRNHETDFIYQDELEAMQANGLLARLDLAFSRDQEEKVYVQNRMLENGAELFDWLERGGYFFVCGDATRMAKDVDEALHKLIAEHGKLSDEDAKAYVSNLKRQKRYVRDVY